eukprot:gene18435-20284_t
MSNTSKSEFSRKCGARTHNNDRPTGRLLKIREPKGKKEGKIKISKEQAIQLVNDNVITNKTNFICKTCFEAAIKDCAAGSSTSAESSKQKDLDFEKYLESIVELVKNDVKTLFMEPTTCSIENLLSYNSKEWLSQRPELLVKLLAHLCQVTNSQLMYENRCTLFLSRIIEIIYSAVNSRIVLPISFSENIHAFSVSHSKQLVEYNNAVGPAGSYSFLQKWIFSQAVAPSDFPEGLVKCVFDNEQVIGKTRSIKTENKVPLSVITSFANIVIDEKCSLQKEVSLCPRMWFFEKLTTEKKEKIKSNICLSKIRTSRDAFISSRLEVVRKEQRFEGEQIIDYIDNHVQSLCEAEKEKLCVDCGGANDIAYNTCRNCNGALAKSKVTISDFIDCNKEIHISKVFADFVDGKKIVCKIRTGEPDLVNPNDYENIAQILRNLGKRAGIKRYIAGGTGRQWLIIEVDGLIYCIVEQLIFHTLHCPVCKTSYFGADSFNTHECTLSKNIVPEHEFDWLILQPGLLHFEMNACKSIMNFNWEIFGEEVVRSLGFTTTKALDYAKRCSDHHKTWEIMQLMYIAIADELLVPFVRNCMKLDLEISVDRYWAWYQESAINPNYTYMMQVTFTYLHNLMLFREGVRMGDYSLAEAAREQLQIVFFARSHPKYRRIVALDKMWKELLPEKLVEVLKCSFAASRVNNHGHYQGGDASLEEINKNAKAWVTSGVPTDDNWLKIFRNLDELCKVRQY